MKKKPMPAATKAYMAKKKMAAPTAGTANDPALGKHDAYPYGNKGPSTAKDPMPGKGDPKGGPYGADTGMMKHSKRKPMTPAMMARMKKKVY